MRLAIWGWGLGTLAYRIAEVQLQAPGPCFIGRGPDDFTAEGRYSVDSGRIITTMMVMLVGFCIPAAMLTASKQLDKP